MDDVEWARATERLSEAADFMVILSRCLDVRPQLSDWRHTATHAAGDSAADALDQASGMLERLLNGEAASLLELIETMLEDLPPALD